jgi:hypothetical protein
MKSKVKNDVCPKCQGSMKMNNTEKLERAGVVRILKAFGPALPGVELKLSCAEDLCYPCFKKELLPEIQAQLNVHLGQQLKENDIKVIGQELGAIEKEDYGSK